MLLAKVQNFFRRPVRRFLESDAEEQRREKLEMERRLREAEARLRLLQWQTDVETRREMGTDEDSRRSG